MRSGVILLKHGNDAMILQERNNMWCKDTVSIFLGVQIPIDNNKLGTVPKTNTCPDHYRSSSSKTIPFKNAAVGVTFVPTSIHSGTFISLSKQES